MYCSKKVSNYDLLSHTDAYRSNYLSHVTPILSYHPIKVRGYVARAEADQKAVDNAVTLRWAGLSSEAKKYFL